MRVSRSREGLRQFVSIARSRATLRRPGQKPDTGHCSARNKVQSGLSRVSFAFACESMRCVASRCVALRYQCLSKFCRSLPDLGFFGGWLLLVCSLGSVGVAEVRLQVCQDVCLVAFSRRQRSGRDAKVGVQARCNIFIFFIRQTSKEWVY